MLRYPSLWTMVFTSVPRLLCAAVQYGRSDSDEGVAENETCGPAGTSDPAAHFSVRWRYPTDEDSAPSTNQTSPVVGSTALPEGH